MSDWNLAPAGRRVQCRAPRAHAAGAWASIAAAAAPGRSDAFAAWAALQNRFPRPRCPPC